MRTTLLFTALMCALVVPALASDTPPNIILILADDQGWTDTSVQMDPRILESKSDFHQTPNLEALASQGMRFSAAYAAPVCSPTRAAIQTGKSPAQLQIADHIARAEVGSQAFLNYYVGVPLSAPLPRGALPGSEITIAERIRQGNPKYRTAYVGGWGLGQGRDVNPLHQGYETQLLGDSPTDIDPKKTFSYTNAATTYMEERVSADEPFFLQLSYDAVHTPYKARPETLSKYKQLTPGTRHKNPFYAAMTEDLDTAVGTVLDKIQALGIEENTYVIYYSDNGGHRYFNQPVLFQGKGTLWEGGIRVPMIIKGPGIEPDTVSDVPVIAMDLFSTIADLAGVTDTPPSGVEGASLLPILENGGRLPEEMTSLRRQYADNGELFFHFPRYFAGPPQSAVIDGDFKLLKRYGARDVPERIYLFDRTRGVYEPLNVEDPTNLAEAMPEKTAQLLEKLDNWLEAVDASLPYDVAAKTQLRWDASQPGQLDEQWRSTVDVDYLARETWTFANNPNAPQRVKIDPYQPNLPRHAFDFDGEDGMIHNFFHVSDPDQPGQYDKDHSASFEFWLRLNSMTQSHLLFESGDSSRGLSITVGDGDEDGSFDELRFRAKDQITDITVTSELDLFANPVRDFVHVVAVLGDQDDNRYAEVYVNGALFDRVNERNGESRHIDWDGWDEAGIGRPGGNELGADGGAGSGTGGQGGSVGGGGDQPFSGGNFNGELASFNFYNYAIDGDTVLRHYNAMLDNVDLGIVATSGALHVPAERPSDLREGGLEASSAMVMQERSDILDNEMRVDVLPDSDQTYDADEPTSDFDGFLPAGTDFTTYLVHFDPLGDPASAQVASGTVRFAQPILGILFDRMILDETDAILGAMGQYPVNRRAFDLGGNDFLALSDNLRTLTFSLSARNEGIAQLRVLTAMVPEPSSALLLMGLSGVLITVRRPR